MSTALNDDVDFPNVRQVFRLHRHTRRLITGEVSEETVVGIRTAVHGFSEPKRTFFQADGTPVINDVGLAALALLVAESDPGDKDILIRLIINMLSADQTTGPEPSFPPPA